MRKPVCLYTAIALLVAVCSASAQDGQKVKEIVYDHAKVNDNRAYKIFAAPGELIRVKITNTCPESFDYRVIRVEGAPLVADDAGDCQLSDAPPIDILHEEKYGGYIVEVDLKPDTPMPQVTFDGKTKELQPVDILINVESKLWDYEMSGAFTTSRLTDPRFGLEMRDDPSTTDDTTEKPFVVTDEDAEDEARLGVGAFIHLFQPKRPHLGYTFGLGINDNNKTTYFTGISYRFGEAGAFTVGYNWGSVSRLPAGTRADRPVAPDLLSKLETKVKGDVFIALSYKFLNPSGRLEKPFQEVPASSGGTATGNDDEEEEEEEEETDPAVSPSVPRAPTVRTPTATCSSVTLQWDAVAGDQITYRVFRSTTSCDDVSPIAEGINGTEHRDETVLPNVEYHYRVRSDNGQESDLSACQSITTPACP